MTQAADRPAPARLRGPDRLAAGGRRPREAARRDAARDRPAQEHDDRVPLRQRLAAGPAPHPRRQVPALRGVAARAADRARPGRAGRQDGARAGLEHRLRPDAASTPPTRKAGPHDGRRLAAADAAQPAQAPEPASLEIEALDPLFRGNVPVNAWDRPYTGVRTDRYTYVVYKETGEQELYDRRKDPYQLTNVAARPGLRRGQGEARGGSSRSSTRCKGRSCNVAAMRAAVAAGRRRGRARMPPRRQRRPPSAGLHDARYCEIIELKGAPPDATAVVWNTIGLNKCPAAWWNAFDAGDLARELGATLVVLNGPRHFLMDSVTATPGRVRSFHGQRLRRVATIPIRTAADLARTPYTDRTVERGNTWRWKAGGASTSWSRPAATSTSCRPTRRSATRTLKIGDLRTLGRRLDLPPGWRYRTRALRRAAGRRRAGRQGDDHPGRAPEHLPAGPHDPRAGPAQAPPGQPRRPRRSPCPTTQPGTIEDRGSITRHAVRARDGHAQRRPRGRAQSTGTVRLLYPNGSITGTLRHGRSRSAAARSTSSGTARFTGGTGAYRGITSGALGRPRPQHARRPERGRVGRRVRQVLAGGGQAQPDPAGHRPATRAAALARPTRPGSTS